MYNMIEYTDNYSKITGNLGQYYRDDPNDTITRSELFKYNIKITDKHRVDGNKKYIKITVSLKYLSNFWRTLEMLLINCEANLILTWMDLTWKIVLFLLQVEKQMLNKRYKTLCSCCNLVSSR